MRTLLMLLCVVLLGCRASKPPPDPSLLARAAHADARLAGVDYEFLDRDGRVFASVKGDRVESGGVVGTVDGDQLTLEGVTIGLPDARGDPEVSLVALLRPARYDGNALVLEGEPQARAWLASDNRLERLEVDLPDGCRMVVKRRER